MQPRRVMSIVLIVEDNPDLADLLRTAIAWELHCYTLVASDAEHAQRYLHAIRPNLIVLDVNLPTISGVELYDVLQRYDGLREIPVLFLTGAADDDEFKERAFENVIPKPFKLDALLSKVSELCACTYPQEAGALYP